MYVKSNNLCTSQNVVNSRSKYPAYCVRGSQVTHLASNGAAEKAATCAIAGADFAAL